MNRELGAEFQPGCFRHEAVWVPALSRIEMHPISVCAQTAQIAGERVEFAAGERLVAEPCHKHTPQSFAAQGRAAGRAPRRSWTDSPGYFSVRYPETEGVENV